MLKSKKDKQCKGADSQILPPSINNLQNACTLNLVDKNTCYHVLRHSSYFGHMLNSPNDVMISISIEKTTFLFASLGAVDSKTLLAHCYFLQHLLEKLKSYF